jgi:hypothetical protein
MNSLFNRTEIYAARNVNWESVARKPYKILVVKLMGEDQLEYLSIGEG